MVSKGNGEGDRRVQGDDPRATEAALHARSFTLGRALNLGTSEVYRAGERW